MNRKIWKTTIMLYILFLYQTTPLTLMITTNNMLYLSLNFSSKFSYTSLFHPLRKPFKTFNFSSNTTAIQPFKGKSLQAPITTSLKSLFLIHKLLNLKGFETQSNSS